MGRCLMLASSFHTAIDMDSIISQDDLYDDGIVKDSHITIVYSDNNEIDKNSILEDVRKALGDDEFKVFMEFMKDSYKFNVNDLFHLDSFNNEDCSYLILRLNKSNELYDMLDKIHRYIVSYYGISETYPEYNPHITIAKLNSNEADKYLRNDILLKVLSDSKVGFEDLVFSSNSEGSTEKWDKWNITTFHALDRFFRESRTE